MRAIEFIVQVVRYANEGFNIKPYRSKAYYHTGDFFNYSVERNNLHQTVNLYKRDTDRMMVPNPEGCFAFLYNYDISQINKTGNLFIRSNARKNVGYLRLDEVVYVRNIHANMKQRFIGEIIHEIPDPYTGIMYEFPKSSMYDELNWVQMPVSLFLERSKEHFNMFGRMYERISEVYLTAEQVGRIIPHTNIFFLKRFTKKYKLIS
ncbi:hypothetical protein [Paenibacillus tepidiphilus]|uniref:hypothetical protein n=1 Tax=Paenibacillus tepidiphilus TaxID=2608683 RepID=UPI0012394356|nr:hypothetical protein [Paenibacillus tepidiphilus]